MTSSCIQSSERRPDLRRHRVQRSEDGDVNGLTPKVRAELVKAFRSIESDKCPFANLPENHAGRWGVGLTAAKMADCRWLEPRIVGQFEFVEWTPDNHLRHSRFMGLRKDKSVKDVRRE